MSHSGAAVWQPTALNLLFLSCVTGVRVYTVYIIMLVERFVLTEIKIIIFKPSVSMIPRDFGKKIK